MIASARQDASSRLRPNPASTYVATGSTPRATCTPHGAKGTLTSSNTAEIVRAAFRKSRLQERRLSKALNAARYDSTVAPTPIASTGTHS